MFETKTIVTLGACGALAFIVPIAVTILYKIRHKSAWGVSAVIGAGTFIVFAMVLEQLLHKVMLPIVGNSTVLYILYGALAAGVFEETGRFLATKYLMRNRLSTENAVLMGLGHGGIEAVALLGLTMFAYAGMALYVNSVGLSEAVTKLSGGDVLLADVVRAQLNAVKEYSALNALMSVYERFIAMVFHVCMSVWAYKAVTHKMRFYPAAIAAHALLDVPAAMYQIKVITSVPIVYVIMTAYVALIVVVTIKMINKFPKKVR